VAYPFTIVLDLRRQLLYASAAPFVLRTRSIFNRQKAMINLKAEGQLQQPLRTSALRLIFLTRT